MPKHETTPGRGYPLPHVGNKLDIDVDRIRAAITAVDADYLKLVLQWKEFYGIADGYLKRIDDRQGHFDVATALTLLQINNAITATIAAFETDKNGHIADLVQSNSDLLDGVRTDVENELQRLSDFVNERINKEIDGHDKSNAAHLLTEAQWSFLRSVKVDPADKDLYLCVDLDDNDKPVIVQRKAGGGVMRSEIYANPGTYTWIVPYRVTEIYVTMCGGGGGGSNTTASNVGGSGGCVIRCKIDVTPFSKYNLIIGNGGASGSAGTSGGTTSFESILSCSGGGGAMNNGGNGTFGVGGTPGGVGGDHLGGKSPLTDFSLNCLVQNHVFGCGGAKSTPGGKGIIIIEYL